MTLILDAGGVTALASNRGWLTMWYERSTSVRLPAVVVTEVLTGDHRRDHEVNRMLGYCMIAEVDESLAREGARLRTLTRRAGTISATDAVVAAFAANQSDPVVLTSDPKDLMALAEHTGDGGHPPVKISSV